MRPATFRYVLGLGSNLGDRAGYLRAAVSGIDALPGVTVVNRSSIYCTAPVGGPEQADYLNAAIAVSTSLDPEALMALLLSVERELGRVRPDAVRWGPRTIDIDILWWSEGIARSPSAKVPHPRLTERAFALVPLLDVMPDAHDPASGLAYRALPSARLAMREHPDKL